MGKKSTIDTKPQIVKDVEWIQNNSPEVIRLPKDENGCLKKDMELYKTISSKEPLKSITLNPNEVDKNFVKLYYGMRIELIKNMLEIYGIDFGDTFTNKFWEQPIYKKDEKGNLEIVNGLVFENGAAGILPITGTDKQKVAKECYNTFSKHNFTKNQIIGILCNIYQESGFNHKVVSPDSSKSQGLCQWLGIRITRFRQKYGKEIIESTPREQINYAISEIMENPSYYKYNELKSSKTIGEACGIWLKYFERPGATFEEEYHRRMSHLPKVRQLLSL